MMSYRLIASDGNTIYKIPSIMSPEKKTEKDKIIFLNYKNKLEEIS
jgi:hypothetical protein